MGLELANGTLQDFVKPRKQSALFVKPRHQSPLSVGSPARVKAVVSAMLDVATALEYLHSRETCCGKVRACGQ